MAGHDRITPQGRRFYAEIDQLKKLQVRVGFQSGDATDDNGVDIANIAMFNEVGTAHIPSRPFLRQSIDNNGPAVNAACREAIGGLSSGQSAEGILNAVGVMQRGLVQKEISSGNFAPNAPATILRKKSDRPLIDTGRMRQSVNYFIVPKGSRD